ncbi:MAG: cytochrome c biogenesis protein CcdA [Alphaproteobacteria bacterium]|nr:cytochrome c biogenesis protein CcdA [Alphaproteobacteria bacterium]
MSGLDVSYLAAAGAGALSFVSPCVLPLVPAYLCFVAGTSLDRLTGGEAIDRDLEQRLLWRALAFVLGFSTVFVALGASASAVNRLLFEHLDWLAKAAGVVIVLLGIHVTGLVRIGWLNVDARFAPLAKPRGLAGAFVVGLAFAFGWTPCVGPILAAILTLAAGRESLAYGTTLLATYALGLGVPFLLAAWGMKPFLGFMARFRRYIRGVEIATGGLLVLTGGLILSGGLQSLAGYLLDWFPALAKIG